MHLRCSNPDCAATLDLHDRALSCPVCADLLEVAVDGVAGTPAELKRRWIERRCSYAPLDASGVWRFREFLPNGYSNVVTMSEGNNPLVKGRKTAQWAGVRNLNFKHLGWNLTACFKDLGMTVGMTEAVYVGRRTTRNCPESEGAAASAPLWPSQIEPSREQGCPIHRASSEAVDSEPRLRAGSRLATARIVRYAAALRLRRLSCHIQACRALG